MRPRFEQEVWGGLQISAGQFCMCNFALLWLSEPSSYEHCPLISTIQGLQMNHLHVVVFEFRLLLPEAKALTLGRNSV